MILTKVVGYESFHSENSRNATHVMANAFGIITALVLAAAAFFGFKNKAALEDQSAALSSEERKLELNENTFEERKEELSGLEADTKAANEENAELTEKLEAQLAKNKAFMRTSMTRKARSSPKRRKWRADKRSSLNLVIWRT